MSISALIEAIESLKKREGNLLPVLKAIFFEELKRKYPRKPIKDVLLEHKGGSWGNDYFKESIEAKVLRSPDVRFGFIDFEGAETRYFTENEIAKFNLKNNDIAVIKSNGSLDLVGKSQLYKNNSKFPYVVASNFLMVLTPNEEIIYPEYLDLFLKSPESLVWRFDTQKTTTGLRNLNSQGFLNIEMPVPCSIEEQKNLFDLFKSYLEGNMEQMGANLKGLYTITKTKEQLNTELTHQLDTVKQLRQAFLREAMQGKLVEQNPNDEPASELLKKIKAEKEKLPNKRTKEKPLAPVKPEEIPFEIPANWVWCRLGEIALNISTGPFGTMLHKSDYVSNGIPLVNPMNIVNEKIMASDKMMINENTKARLKSYVLNVGDVVIGRRGEMGRCAVVTETESGWICGTGSFFLQLHNDIQRPYFIKVLGTEFAKSILLGESVGSTMNNLNHKILSNLPIPLPPLTEQQRIVNKLEQLMSFCDELEKSIKQSKEQNEKLLQQVLREALSGSSNEVPAENLACVPA